MVEVIEGKHEHTHSLLC